MKRILTLLICLLCFLLVICACDNSSVDTTSTDPNADTSTSADSPANSKDTDKTDDADYPFSSPGTYIPDDTDDPNTFINIAPIDDGDKWGKINIKPE